jgi:selenide,water dikinase
VTCRLVLLGGGHAHLFVLEGLTRGHPPGLEVTLISVDDRQAYSGMVPGMIGGRYRTAELMFALPAICRRVGVAFVRAEVSRLLPAERQVQLADGRSFGYDLLSVATGSTVEGAGHPGVRAQARMVKPISRAVEIVPSLERAAETGSPATVVVGGGAAGIEVALAVRARLRLLGRPDAAVTLVESRKQLLGGLKAPTRAVARALAENTVTVLCGTPVSRVDPEGVRLEDGTGLPARVVVWATGAAAPSFLRGSGLPVDRRGFLLVDDRLRSIGDTRIFAAGDAATPERFPATPKAGVYAVREGPVLNRNLLAAAAGSAPPARYTPQRRFLALLNTGDGKAVLSYGKFAVWTRWAMALKDRIDRSFMRRFQRLEATGM